nr:Chain D, Rps25A-peptide [Saccharomyces cerevisiae]
PPKQQL